MTTIFRIKFFHLLVSTILVALILVGAMGSYVLVQVDTEACISTLSVEHTEACSMGIANCTENCEDPVLTPTPPPPGQNCSEHCVDVGWNEILSNAVI